MDNLWKLCIVAFILAAVALFIFKLPINSILFYGFLLACPLLHLMMMRGDHSDSKHNKHSKS